MVEILKQAATYEGGLDRGNIMLAARHIDDQNPLLLDGITPEHGLRQGRLPASRAVEMVKYTVTDPAALGSFTPAGDLIDNNGKIGNYDDFLAASGG